MFSSLPSTVNSDFCSTNPRFWKEKTAEGRQNNAEVTSFGVYPAFNLRFPVSKSEANQNAATNCPAVCVQPQASFLAVDTLLEVE